MVSHYIQIISISLYQTLRPRSPCFDVHVAQLWLQPDNFPEPPFCMFTHCWKIRMSNLWRTDQSTPIVTSLLLQITFMSYSQSWKDIILNNSKPQRNKSGAILEIGPRVGVNPSTWHFDTLFWPIFSVYTQKESRSLFKGLKLLYSVQNSAPLVALDWSRDIK